MCVFLCLNPFLITSAVHRITYQRENTAGESKLPIHHQNTKKRPGQRRSFSMGPIQRFRL